MRGSFPQEETLTFLQIPLFFCTRTPDSEKPAREKPGVGLWAWEAARIPEPNKGEGWRCLDSCRSQTFGIFQLISILDAEEAQRETSLHFEGAHLQFPELSWTGMKA